MRGRALCVVLGSLLLFATLLGVGSHVAVAAKTPVDIPGSLWLTDGLLKLSGSGGSDMAVMQAIVGFGPLDDLAADECGINVEPGDLNLVVLGTYFERVPGKPVCLVATDPLADEIKDAFGIPPELNLTVRAATFKVTPKTKKGIETIRAFLNIKLQVCGIDDRGRYRCLNSTLQYKGVGGRFEDM